VHRTIRLTPEQMNAQIFRYSERRPHTNLTGDTDIPAEVYDALNPRLFFMLAHAQGDEPDASRPAVTGARGLSVAIIELRPGERIPHHVHLRSRETYVCLEGRALVRWNDHGEHEAHLDPYDMIDVPPGVYRSFFCDGDVTVKLLGIVADDREGEPDDVYIAAAERARATGRFGDEVVDRLSASTGLLFADPNGEDPSPT
jgi:mannose-6-phosphate isomerase-like protein (cupin superfamily)